MWESIHRVVTEVFGFFSSVILCIVHGEEVISKTAGYLGVKEWVERRTERRHTMSLGNIIQDAEALIALEPLLIKFIEDARAAAPQLEADAESLIAKLKTIFHDTPVITTTTTTVSSPPAGQV